MDKYSKLIITKNAGFFSCCTIRLFYIIEYYNKYNILPFYIDSSKQFEWYKKKDKRDDITFEYFKYYNKINYKIHKNSLFILKDLRFTKEPPEYYNKNNYKINDLNASNVQYKNYKYINLKYINKFVEKYFSISIKIKNIISNLEKKYNINDYKNLCVLFYRGNDKNTETKICNYDEYILKASEIQLRNKNIKFLIQSDETEFIETIKNKFPNSFYFKDEIRHIPRQNTTVDKVFKNTNNKFSKYFLAITIIMSKCNYVICGSGNCSLWIMLYRNNTNNVYQNLNNKWL